MVAAEIEHFMINLCVFYLYLLINFTLVLEVLKQPCVKMDNIFSIQLFLQYTWGISF